MIYTDQIDCASRDTFFRDPAPINPQISQTRSRRESRARKTPGDAIAVTRSARARSPARRDCFRCEERPRTAHPAHQSKPGGAGGSNHERRVLPMSTGSPARSPVAKPSVRRRPRGRGAICLCRPCGARPPQNLRDGRIRAARKRARTYETHTRISPGGEPGLDLHSSRGVRNREEYQNL
jgi:hypothetical protein